MTIHNPHDKFVKIVLALREVAADLLRAYLPPRALKKLDLSSLELENGSYVSKDFKDFRSDILLKADGKEGIGYVYFLLEHQSTSDALVVGRLLQYMGNIMIYDMKRQLSIDPNRSNLKVPVIYPLVLYSGNKKYKWPKKFSIEVDGLPILDLSSSLIELREYSLQDLLKSDKAALAQFLLKESWKKDFCKVLKDNPKLSELISASPYAEDAVLYMVDQDQQPGEKVINTIKNLDPKVKEKVMTGLQRIEQRGRIEGIKLGEQRGKIEGIKLGEQVGEQRGFKDAIVRLLSHGVDKAQAAEMLGLTLKQLEDFLKA